MQQHSFYKDAMGWFIDLPDYIANGGTKADLQMVSGADTMLDVMAEGREKVTIQIDETPFSDADELCLTELCDPILGGGIYEMKSFEGKRINQQMWLCTVTEFVFGYMPRNIYAKRLPSSMA